MSAYPPPSPGQPFDRATLRMQRQAMKQQARMQRQQMRWQRRLLRRNSIVGPLLILAIGLVFLLAQIGTISWPQTLDWFGSWWPLVLIGAGALLVGEWFLDQHLRTTDAQRPAHSIGGGVIFLLILVALVGASSHGMHRAIDWKTDKFGPGLSFLNMAWGDPHSMDDTAESTIGPNGALLIRNPNGDVTVTGSSDDGQIHVNVHKEIRSRNDQETEDKRAQLQPVFTGVPSSMMLDIPSVAGSHDDIVVQVPHNTVLTVSADHGSIDIQEIHAPVTVTAGKGEVNVSGINGPLNAHLNSSDAAFSAHSVTGEVLVDGKGGDVNLSDIQGPIALRGEFFGTTHMERTTGTVEFRSHRTLFHAARIDGELEIEPNSNMQADSVLGPVELRTSYRNITLDRVQGGVQITNRDGSVKITNAAPLANIDINNQHGGVEVGVPANAGFSVNAETKHGDIENDFGLHSSEDDHHTVLTGNVASGGPTIRIQTTDGDVILSKSTVAPLPPNAPAPPRITDAPPPSPAAPKAPKVHVPSAPKAPAAPTAPAPQGI